MTAAAVRARVYFHGRVQGVFFRATTRELAQRLPLSGFVRNLADGSVEMEAQGSADAVDALIRDVSAHYAANITRTQRLEIALREGERGFEITR